MIAKKIADDSGFVGIVNPNTYNSFVSEEWELPQLFTHFVNEMNNEHLILWGTGAENTWTIEFRDKPSDMKSFKEFSQTLEVTIGKIFLTNYEDLTMAAQFDDVKIPSNHNRDLYFELDNGRHEFIIRQLFDPEVNTQQISEHPHFEIVVRPETQKNSKLLSNINWAAH